MSTVPIIPVRFPRRTRTSAKPKKPNKPDPVKPQEPKKPDPVKPCEHNKPDPVKPQEPKKPDPVKPQEPKKPDPVKPCEHNKPDPVKPQEPNKPTDVRLPSLADLPPLPPASEPPRGAIVGETLKSFRWIDSLVCPPGAAPEIPNIVQLGPRVFAHVLRHRGTWHDGDRHLSTGGYENKARAELSCLGGNTPYTLGSTWLIGTTVRLNPDFVPSRGYCNIMQPVLHQSYFTLHDLRGDVVTGSLRVFEAGLGSTSRTVRTVQFPRGRWVPLVVRVTFARRGEYALSVNGDEFRGIGGVDTTIGHGQMPFGGTFGLYMSATGAVDGRPQRDAIVQHANMWIKRVK